MCNTKTSLTQDNEHVKYDIEEQFELDFTISKRSCGEKCKSCKRLLCETPAPVVSHEHPRKGTYFVK